ALGLDLPLRAARRRDARRRRDRARRGRGADARLAGGGASAALRPLMHVHLVVRDAELALDEEAVVVGEEHRALDVVAREGADVVERVEEEDRLERRAVALAPAQHERAAGAGERTRAAHSRLLEVRRVRVGVLGPRRAAPDARDHAPPSRYCVSQPATSYADPRGAPIERMTVPSSSATASRSAAGSEM